MASQAEIRYYNDPTTGEPHIYNHGVEEWEIEDILDAKALDFRGRLGSRIALGQRSAGRYLKVVYAPASARNSIFVIKAYELRGKALKAFRKLKRRKQGKRRR